MKESIIFSVLLLLLGLSPACDRPRCETANAVFKDHAIESIEYKKELSQEIEEQNKEELQFWFKKYKKDEKGERIYVNVQGEALCAIMELEVFSWEGIENIRKYKGKSYVGAELIDLRYDVVKENGDVRFVYQGVEGIFD